MIQIKTILFPLLLVTLTQSFILEMFEKGRRCYSTDLSPDKTLDVRFGFPRREKDNCEYRLQIDRLSDDKSQRLQLYDGSFFCYEMSLRDHFVYKHTAQQYQYDGSYQICIENVRQFSNNQTYVQLLIKENYDPSMYMDPQTSIPLVQSSELIQLNQLIMIIKKGLRWSQEHIKEAQKMGDGLEAKLLQTSQMHKFATYIQIVFLFIYGIAWVILVSGLKKNV